MSYWLLQSRSAISAALDELAGHSVSRGIVEAQIYEAYRKYAELVPQGQGQSLAAEAAWWQAKEELMRERYPEYVKGERKEVGLFKLCRNSG